MRSGKRSFGWAACAGAVLSLFVALIAGRAALSAEPGPSAQAAWVRPGLAADRPAAGYMVLRGGARDDQLVGVTSPGAASIELHDTMRKAGVMHMTQQMSVAVPARAVVRFTPGGRHLMIFGLKPDSTPVPLELRFASGARVRVDAVRRSAMVY
jgi:copper(I)-binding protein